MKFGKTSVPIILLALVLVGCDLTPSTSADDWATVTVSLFGTAYSDVDITVQTDVEGTHTYIVLLGFLPWQYYQFSFVNDYSIQVIATPVSITTSTTTANSSSFNTGTQTVFTVTDASASFIADAARQDIIRNDNSLASVKVFGVIDDQNLYIYGDSNDQNIFDPVSYPFPVPYTIFRSHELWLRTIVTDSENNQSETTYYQQNDVINLQAAY